MRQPRTSIGRTPQFRKAVAGQQVSRETTLPAPVLGWNTRESLAEMDEKYVVETDNIFGDTTDIRTRQGVTDHVTGISDEVETLMGYNGGATQTLFAATDAGDIYNVTSAGAVGAAVVTGLTSGRFQFENFTVSDGTAYLCAFNGSDSPRYWNGSSWITVTGVSSPAITGLTTSSIIGTFVFKRRMYLIENDTLDLWYLPVDSVGGEAKSLPLGSYLSKGGYLVAGGTWTLDGGDGVDDYMVVISSEGQLAVFQGTNPSSASSFSLVGVWNVGEPIGRRCMIKYGGDLLILTNQGLFPLTDALKASESGSNLKADLALTYNINSTMRQAAENYKTNFGWSMGFYPQGNMLVLNVPVSTGTEQFAMNTINRSWWRFSGIDANCWEVFGEEMYFGSEGTVEKYGGSVFTDNGDDIDAGYQQAFSYLGARGRLKKIKAVRPNILATGSPAIQVTFAVDFGSKGATSSLSFSPIVEGVWDNATWDNGTWGGEVVAFADWQTVGAVGTAMALAVDTTVNGIDLRIASTDVVFEYGGVIA